MNRIAALPLLTLMLLAYSAGAQTAVMPSVDQAASSTVAQDTVDVQHVMDAFHQAVVGHDGARLSTLFLPEGSTWVNVLSDTAYAQLKVNKPGLAKIRVSNYKDFAKFVSGSKSSLDPQHSHVQMHTDGAIASVYFDFVFMIDGKGENRGSETWQLVKGVDGWRIAAITYSSDPHVS